MFTTEESDTAEGDTAGRTAARRWEVTGPPGSRPRRLTRVLKLRVEPSLLRLIQAMCATAHWEQSTMVRFAIRELAGRVGMTEAAGTEAAGYV